MSIWRKDISYGGVILSRDTSYRRKMRNKHIERKKNIVKNIRHSSSEMLENERFVGGLDKGKVHCSCPLCREKTGEMGYSISDRRKPSFYEDV